MTMIVIICFVIPFTLFFYEADSEKCALSLSILIKLTLINPNSLSN